MLFLCNIKKILVDIISDIPYNRCMVNETEKDLKQYNNVELNKELMSVVSQYSTGLLTDIELLQCCDKLKELYASIDLSELCDPNTGLRYPKGYSPFNTKE